MTHKMTDKIVGDPIKNVFGKSNMVGNMMFTDKNEVQLILFSQLHRKISMKIFNGSTNHDRHGMAKIQIFNFLPNSKIFFRASLKEGYFVNENF